MYIQPRAKCVQHIPGPEHRPGHLGERRGRGQGESEEVCERQIGACSVARQMRVGDKQGRRIGGFEGARMGGELSKHEGVLFHW